MLTHYITNQNSNFNSDRLEIIGNVLLKPLRLVCGRNVKIDRDLKATELPAANKTQRFAVAIFSSIFFMITLPALIIGIACTWNSKSYKHFNALEVSHLKTSDNETQQINLETNLQDSGDQTLKIFQEYEACILRIKFKGRRRARGKHATVC